MESLLSGVSQHGYTILFALVFLETIGFPLPAALALLIAGAASAQGSLFFPMAAGGAFVSMLAGDSLMFLLGRLTGWWLLSLLCRLSLNPESCILRSADSFYKRGRILLVFAKFVPGINTMAPPLAGSMNMRFPQFLRFDFAGATLYIGTYLSIGFLFNDALAPITRGYHAAGRVVGWVLITLLAGYVGFQVWVWIRSRSRGVPFVTPAEASRSLSSGTAVIYDVRSHGYHDHRAMRVKGSQRLDPNALNQPGEIVPLGRPVYFYCTCVRDATSSRVAQHLLKQGVRAAVIKGGLRAWKKAGLPLEPVPASEVAVLPVFD